MKAKIYLLHDGNLLAPKHFHNFKLVKIAFCIFVLFVHELALQAYYIL